MENLWARLERWLDKHGAGSLRWRPGAAKADIAAAEKTMKVKFPADFRAHLLLHDGQESDPESQWMPGCAPLQPLHAMVARWQDERGMDEDQRVIAEESDDGKHKLGLWYPRRIPIAGSQWWDGDNTYLDFDPGGSGVAGQVITFTTECDLAVLGASFRQAVEKYVLLLERGKLVWDKRRKDVFPADGKWKGNQAWQIAGMTVGRGRGGAAKAAVAAPKPAVAAPKPASGARRFEMTAGGSAKFWEVAVAGAVLSVRFGRLGTDGQKKDKKLASPAAAAKAADALVREKTGKGYVETKRAAKAKK